MCILLDTHEWPKDDYDPTPTSDPKAGGGLGHWQLHRRQYGVMTTEPTLPKGTWSENRGGIKSRDKKL